MMLNRLRDTDLATRLVMNSERLKQWADFNDEVVNISQARAAAAVAYTLSR